MLNKPYLSIILFLIFSIPLASYQIKIDSLRSIIESSDNDSIIAVNLNQLAFETKEINPEQSIQYAEEGLDLSLKNNFKSIEGDLYNTLGIIYTRIPNYPEALKYLYKSIDIKERLDSISDVASINNNIGIIYKNQGNYEKALETFKTFLQKSIELNDTNYISIAFNNIGEVFYAQLQLDSAIKYYNNSLEIERKIGSKLGLAQSLNNVGLIYFESRDLENALDYFNEAIELAYELNNKFGIALIKGNLSKVYYEDYFLDQTNSKLKLAIDSLKNSIELFEEFGELENRSTLLSLLTDAYKTKGDYKSALESFEEFKILRDSIFNDSHSKELGRLEAQRDQEIALREKEKADRLLQAKIERRDSLQYSAISIFALLIFISIFILSKKGISINLMDSLILLAFLFLFEFVTVFMDPFVFKWTSGQPILELLINLLIAFMLLPIRNLENLMKNKLIKE